MLGRLSCESLTPVDSEHQPHELGRVVLGSGEYSFIHFAKFGSEEHPVLFLHSVDRNGGGGGECSDRLSWVLGHSGMMSTNLDSGPYQVHGEVAAGYAHVSLICRDGTQADTTVLDCMDHLGFNVYVAEVMSDPLRIVAANDLGHTVSLLMGQPSFWTHRTPEEAALDGWPTDSGVRVRSVTVEEDRAEVVLDTDRDWPNWVYCVKTRDRWHEAISENGPTTHWDDPWPDPLAPWPP